MKILDIDVRDKKVYTGRYKAVPFEIVNWSFQSTPEDEPKSNWNYYLFLFDKACVDFKTLWLKPKVSRFSEASPWRNHFDYFDVFANVGMHGGITYYEKFGEGVERHVKIGCDFMHLYDDEITWDVVDVVADIKKAIDSLYEYGYLKPLAAE